MKHVDVVVVGGGHAGAEAAAAAARRGATVALVTQDVTRIGAMSCNPSIGGVGKGHLVREVDAFDGLIGRAADAAALHYRMLNKSKGSAVFGPRVQADRRFYATAIQSALAKLPCLQVVQGDVAGLRLAASRVNGVELANGNAIHCKAVVLATGTFLGGRIFRGDQTFDGGRDGERASTYLAQQLRGLGLPISRLKTGTPPRLDGRSIDWAVTRPQPSDREYWTVSPLGGRVLPQLACAITETTPATHSIIRQNLHRSPLQTGAIEAGGPRYCPSIEDKVSRFADRDRHQVFLEPEGIDSPVVYPNGVSTSLPPDVQEAFIRSIPALERAVVTAMGYAVEYDHIDPRALDATLALDSVAGLFFAGQINGTTGYEEAAAQGLVAGLNAAAHAKDLALYQPDRSNSYIGVMIDDLVVQGITEPYRMLTARAEYRLRLRSDNAETRLTASADALGCLTQERKDHLDRRMNERRKAEAGDQNVDRSIVAEIEEDRRYAPYVERQVAEVDRLKRDNAIQLPPIDQLVKVSGISLEMRERLLMAKPRSLGEASRVPGITAAALTAIWLHVRS